MPVIPSQISSSRWFLVPVNNTNLHRCPFCCLIGTIHRMVGRDLDGFIDDQHHLRERRLRHPSSQTGEISPHVSTLCQHLTHTFVEKSPNRSSGWSRGGSTSGNIRICITAYESTNIIDVRCVHSIASRCIHATSGRTTMLTSTINMHPQMASPTVRWSFRVPDHKLCGGVLAKYSTLTQCLVIIMAII